MVQIIPTVVEHSLHNNTGIVQTIGIFEEDREIQQQVMEQEHMEIGDDRVQKGIMFQVP